MSPDLEEDLAMAMRLQQEEDGFLLEPRVEFSEDEHDDDFGNEKKRSRISKGKHAKRKWMIVAQHSLVSSRYTSLYIDEVIPNTVHFIFYKQPKEKINSWKIGQ